MTFSSFPPGVINRADIRASDGPGTVVRRLERALAESGAAAVDPSKRERLTEDELVRCLVDANCTGNVAMSYEIGPYDITKPSIHAICLCRAIERAIGIGEQPTERKT